MSFFRHEEIYRPMDSKNVPGRSWHDRPRPHRYDEFPAGYSSAGCAPAEPASASPAEAHLAGIGSGSTIELQRAVNRLLTPCLTQGDNPNNILRHKSDSLISVGNVGLEFQKAKCLAAEGFADNYILMTNYGLSGASEEKLRKLFLTIPGIKNFVAFGKTWIDHKIRESARLRMLVPQVYGLGDLSQILAQISGVICCHLETLLVLRDVVLLRFRKDLAYLLAPSGSWK